MRAVRNAPTLQILFNFPDDLPDLARPGAAEFDEGALRTQLKDELSAYKIPRRFVAVPSSEIPVMSSGKIDIPRLTKVFDA